MKKFFKLSSSFSKPASFLASKFAKKKKSFKDDLEEVSDLPDTPDLDIKNSSLIEEDVVEQAGAPVDESLMDPLNKVEVFGHSSGRQTLLLNKSDEIFSSPSFDPNFDNTTVKVMEPISLNISSVNAVKYFEKPEKKYPLFSDKTATKEEEYVMQKKIDDLEKVSEKQANEISELKSTLTECLNRIACLEGGLKTNKDKAHMTPNSLKITSPKPKDVQMRKSLQSPRTPVKATRLSGTPTRRSTSDLAKKFKQPWKPAGGLVIYPLIIKKGKISKRFNKIPKRISNQIYNQIALRSVRKSYSWRPPGISVLFCDFNYNAIFNIRKPMIKFKTKRHQFTKHSFKNNHKEAAFVKGEGILRIYIRGRSINLCVPQSLANGFDVKSQTQEPEENLRMEWVYGYRGKDCRKNLYYLPTGDLVYFVAGIVILYNLNTKTQRHYVEHTDDIKCLALHPDKVTFASGQMAGHSKVEGKPHVRVWSSLTLQTIQIIGIGFFERAVSALGFSKSDGGNLLVTVDEANDHNITLWNWSKNKSILTSKSSTEAVIEAEFSPVDCNIIATCGKNHLAFWIVDKTALVKKMAIFEKYEKPKFITCVTFTGTGDLVTGDSSGNIFFWSKEKRSIVSAITQAHNGPIFALLVTEAGSLLSGGGKDHSIFEWDLSTKEKSGKNIQLTEDQGHCRTITEINGNLVIGTTNNGIVQVAGNDEFVSLLDGHSDEVWAMANHPSIEQFVTGGIDRKIIVWDALERSVIHSKQIEKNIQSMSINPSANLLAVGCLEGHWMIYNWNDLSEVYQGRDGNEPIQCCEFSPDGSHLAIGSRDNFIYIYKLNEEATVVTKIGKCSGHSSFITHIDWSTDGANMRSNSGDYELLFWNMSDCKQITATHSLSDVSWNTCNCTIAFEVAGIWPEGSDGTDINAVTKAHNKSLLATADDFGKVNLYRYPACSAKAAHKVYKGHSSHVTGVKFLYGDNRLTSCGGQDTAIVQWALA